MAQWPGQTADDLTRWLHLPAVPRSDQVSMPSADTEYRWDIPKGTREFALIMQDDTVRWRFSANAGEVSTAGAGTPRGPGQSLSYQNGFYTGTVYFAHSEPSAQVMRIEYTRTGS